MPLKAIVDGKTIIAPDLTDEEWSQLKSRHKKGLSISMSCCGAPGHLRSSKKGTRHFYHAVDTGCAYDHESKEHLEIKYLIYRICKAEQWETNLEFASEDRTWISDIYAVKDGRKIVFEIQLSTIPLSDLISRDMKYWNEGIESYWLLDNYLERQKEFESWYDHLVYISDERRKNIIPYIDRSFFFTGTENHIYISKNIRTVGLDSKKQILFTTNNREIPLAVWVREVLKGNYQKYLDECLITFRQKHELKDLAAPILIKFRDFYEKIIRNETYKEKVGRSYQIFKSNERLRNDTALQQKFKEIFFEIDWLKREYQAFMSESYGLFYWKKLSDYSAPYPIFRLESDANIRKLEECIRKFAQWEKSFDIAIENLEREIANRSS